MKVYGKRNRDGGFDIADPPINRREINKGEITRRLGRYRELKYSALTWYYGDVTDEFEAALKEYARNRFNPA